MHSSTRRVPRPRPRASGSTRSSLSVGTVSRALPASAPLGKARAQAQAARFGLDQEQPELGDHLAGSYDEDATDDLAAHLGDPATFSGRLVAADELRDAPRED